MTKFNTSLLFIIILILSLSCQKKVTPEIQKYTISIDSIRKSFDVSGYDTVWFSVSPKDEKKPIVIVNQYEYNGYYEKYANPNIVKATDKYLVLTRDFPEYSNLANIQLTLLAYGTVQSSTNTPYVTSIIANDKSSGKILFQTYTQQWVIWDIKTNKMVSTSSLNLNIVDYNSTSGQILVKDGYYLKLYNEKFDLISTSGYFPSILNAKNLCFTGIGNSVSYYSSHDNLGHNFTFTNTETKTSSESSFYYMYNYNASQNVKAYLSRYGSYYYLRYSINNSSYNTAITEYYNYFSDFEISNNGTYLIYNYNGTLRLHNLQDWASSYINISNNSNYKPCLNGNSNKISFIDIYNKLEIYDIQSNTVSYPLNGTTYGSSSIIAAYW
jgi:hypothetical protein